VRGEASEWLDIEASELDELEVTLIISLSYRWNIISCIRDPSLYHHR
jgi:hypothetical protein